MILQGASLVYLGANAVTGMFAGAIQTWPPSGSAIIYSGDCSNQCVSITLSYNALFNNKFIYWGDGINVSGINGSANTLYKYSNAYGTGICA
jgi:hypothetical protein